MDDVARSTGWKFYKYRDETSWSKLINAYQQVKSDRDLDYIFKSDIKKLEEIAKLLYKNSKIIISYLEYRHRTVKTILIWPEKIVLDSVGHCVITGKVDVGASYITRLESELDYCVTGADECGSHVMMSSHDNPTL